MDGAEGLEGPLGVVELLEDPLGATGSLEGPLGATELSEDPPGVTGLVMLAAGGKGLGCWSALLDSWDGSGSEGDGVYHCAAPRTRAEATAKRGYLIFSEKLDVLIRATQRRILAVLTHQEKGTPSKEKRLRYADPRIRMTRNKGR